MNSYNLRFVGFASMLLVAAAGLAGCPLSSELAFFEDSALEAAVRSRTGKHFGPLTRADLTGSNLVALEAPSRGIRSLEGLQYCTGLSRLDLSGNRVGDITPLANLALLEFLDLSNNRVVDIGPLAGLQALNGMDLAGNPVADLTPLITNALNRRVWDPGSGTYITLDPIDYIVLDADLLNDPEAAQQIAQLRADPPAGFGVNVVLVDSSGIPVHQAR